MFGIGALQRTLSILSAENSDLRFALRSEQDAWRNERESWTKERKDLIDRIIALTKPATHAIMYPESRPSAPPPTPHSARINQPGMGRLVQLPPYPNRPAEKVS